MDNKKPVRVVLYQGDVYRVVYVADQSIEQVASRLVTEFGPLLSASRPSAKTMKGKVKLPKPLPKEKAADVEPVTRGKFWPDDKPVKPRGSFGAKA